MTVAVVIDSATPADATAIGALHARSFAVTYPDLAPIPAATERRIWRRRLVAADGRDVIAARLGRRVVGFAYAGASEDPADATTVGHVFSLHVDPDLHRQGFGRRLLDETLRRFAAAGRSVATLWVVAGNHSARHFYERLGWTFDGTAERQPLALEGDGPLYEVVRYRRAVDGAGAVTAPKYYELRQWLRTQVDGMPPGTPVAPERALSQRFGVSRTTVRQALHDLAVEGRIVRHQGRGTFVAPPKVTQPMELSSFTQAMSSQGRRPGSQVVDVAVVDAEPEVAERLGIGTGTAVVRVERVRYADDEPMAVETVYLDHARFPEVGDALTADSSLYALLESGYGIVPARADETIETVLAPPAAARLLGTDAATPMLLLTRSSRDREGRPVEYVRSLYRGDRFRFSTTLTREPGAT
jgi:GntR family transcriptional regulator, nutrient-sensing system regulator